MQAADALLCLYEHPDRRHPDDTTAHYVSHFALRIADREAWVQRLAQTGEPVYYGEVTDWPNSRSWYVKDPSGHEIEVVSWNEDVVRFAA